MMKTLLLVGFFSLSTVAFAQEPQQPPQPERDALFWCKQQRNFFADTSAENAAAAAQLDKEVTKLRAEIAELKKKLPANGK